MMFMGTYILNVRITLTLKAITVPRVFFSSSLASFFFAVAHFFCTLHRIRNAVSNGIHSLCDERKIPK